MSAPPTIIEAIVKKKAGLTLPRAAPPSPLPPVDMNSEEVLGGVESDEAFSSVEAESSCQESMADLSLGGRGRIFRNGRYRLRW
jgi:hypothetical protein